MILLFIHGWGFDAAFWDELAGLLPGFRTEIDDRGYFGRPYAPRIDGDCVIVAHSFGAMRALAAPPPHWRGLVAINGFDRFTPGVPRRVLDRMIAKFAEEPVTVLAEFRRRCGDNAPFGEPSVTPLRDDLLTLRDGDCSDAEYFRAESSSLGGGGPQQALEGYVHFADGDTPPSALRAATSPSRRGAKVATATIPILSLQGATDPLLPAAMRDGVFAAAPRLERRLHPTAGHLLPASDAPYCARAIRDFVERLA